MGSEWETPKWRREGRTGPGPIAPKYKSRKDRATVRKGGTPGGGKPPKKGSGGGSKPMVVIAVAMLAVPITAVLSIVGYLLHGHGVI